jgi:hypothetical protein
MSSTSPRRTTDRLLQDLITTARLTGVAHDESTLRRVLGRFQDGFLRGSVQFRTTTKAPEKRDLCFRYLDLESGRSPLDIALRCGELTDTGHPLDAWLGWTEQRFPLLGYGADFEARHGLQKVWQFLGGAHDPRSFLELPQMPLAFRASLPLLRDLHLDSVTIVGVDYVQRSLNLYFRPSHPSHRSGALLSQACERLGFPAPGAAAQAHAGQSGCIAFTYAWDSQSIERICFYVAGFTRDAVPDHHPHLRMFAAGAPALAADPRFILGWSHGRSAAYYKLEDDYTGDVTDVFAESMSVDKVPYLAPSMRESPGEGQPVVSPL